MNLSSLWIGSALLASLLVGCATPAPAPVLLTLPSGSAAVPAAAVSAPAGTGGVLAVRRVNVPGYLVARRVRYRSDASTLAEWPNTYWAERIEIGVSREFVAALRRQLPGWTLCDTACGDQNATLSLQVDLVPLDYLRGSRTLNGGARLTLSDGTAARVLRSEASSYTLTVNADSPQAQAQAIAELVNRVAAAAAPLVLATRP